MTRPSTARPPGPQNIESLANRLPSMTVPDAQLRRLTFDARFEHWLREQLGLQDVSIASRPSDPPWILSFDTDHGGCEVAIDLGHWPSLQMALEVPDSVIACAVANQLLQGIFTALAPMLGPIRIVARHRSGSVAGAICLTTGSVRLGLLRCDSGLTQRLMALAEQSGGANISPFASLTVRPRMRLMVRQWTQDVIQSLNTGDVVLTGTRSHVLIAGVGCTLQAHVQINPQEFKLQVAEEPHISNNDAATESNSPGGSLEDLQLPVAFELDTARISLAELATMRPGYAIELDVPLVEATVRLVCHGQTLGHGQLVAIGDQLGIRITRMEYAHDAAVPS